MAQSADVDDLLSWQIGSKRPPRVCLCCGLRFNEGDREIKGPYRTGPYIWVCKVCWELPYLFFPDKIEAVVEAGYVLEGRRKGDPK